MFKSFLQKPLNFNVKEVLFLQFEKVKMATFDEKGK